jgi:hypothetical protein
MVSQHPCTPSTLSGSTFNSPQPWKFIRCQFLVIELTALRHTHVPALTSRDSWQSSVTQLPGCYKCRQQAGTWVRLSAVNSMQEIDKGYISKTEDCWITTNNKVYPLVYWVYSVQGCSGQLCSIRGFLVNDDTQRHLFTLPLHELPTAITQATMPGDAYKLKDTPP